MNYKKCKINSLIYLASSSPRRKQLLGEFGIKAIVCQQNAEEKTNKTKPQEIVMALAKLKVDGVARSFEKTEQQNNEKNSINVLNKKYQNIEESAACKVTESAACKVTESSACKVTESAACKVTESAAYKATESADNKVTESADNKVTESADCKAAENDVFNTAETKKKNIVGKIFLGADTIVWKNGVQYGKPKDKADACRILRALSGKWHTVYTGVNLQNESQCKLFFCKSRVKFRKLSDIEIEKYIDDKKPFDKAGAYGIQDNEVVQKYCGSYTNIVGLPMEKLCKAIRKMEVK